MTHQVKANSEVLTEIRGKGVKLQLPPAIWAAIVVAIGGVVGSLIGAWVQLREIAAATGMG